MKQPISKTDAMSASLPAKGPIEAGSARSWLTKRLGLNAAIGAFCAALVVAIWGAAIIAAQREREHGIAAAIKHNSNLAAAFEEQTIRMVKGVDAATLFIAHEYTRLGAKTNLSDYVAKGLIDSKLLVNVAVADERGDVVLSSGPLKQANIADREPFIVHTREDSGKLFIGKPLLGRITGEWSIPMTRRINKPDGSFAGIVTVSIEPRYFTDFYQKADLGENGLVNLVGLDGITRARRSGHVASFGQQNANTTLFKEQPKSANGDYLSRGAKEDIPRFISYRTLGDYPLIVTVGVSQAEVLAEISKNTNNNYLTAILFSVIIVAFGGLLVAILGRQKSAVAQFRMTFEQAAVGIAQTGFDRRYLQVNQKFCDMLGYTQEELLAMRSNEIAHPDDRETGPEYKLMVAGQLDKYSGEKRYIRKDGSMLWANRTVSLARDGSGKPLYFIRVIEDITERKGLQHDLQHQAHHDSLTQLPNRELFYDRLAHALEQAQRRKWNTGVLFIDLDGFKRVNDTLGHGVGDQLLQQVSERLTRCVRAEDTVGRLGGDEFAIILSELAHEQDGGLVAQKVIDALAKPFQIDGNEIFITASIGITTCPSDSRNADTLISHADAAMYNAKKLGKNNYQFYTAAMNERSMEKLQLEKDLRHALMRNEFVLHFQPKASLHSSRITGVEALLRWQRPDGRLVPPLEFIPVLEESGLIVPAGEWVLRAACEQLNAWQQGGVTPVPIAVNLSAKQFHQQDIAAMVMRALLEYGVDPHLLELEITESAAMHDAKATSATLHKLKALGVHIAIDDFGTGYSSLSYLKRFPIDALKIDRSFVTDLPGNENDASIAQAVITMAHALRLKVIAEGVENEVQLEFLAANGCDEMQGYFFSRPLPVDDCTQLLRGQRKLPLRQTRAG